MGVYHVVCEDERAALRVDFQSFASRTRCHCRMLVSTGKVVFGKVQNYILLI